MNSSLPSFLQPGAGQVICGNSDIADTHPDGMGLRLALPDDPKAQTALYDILLDAKGAKGALAELARSRAVLVIDRVRLSRDQLVAVGARRHSELLCRTKAATPYRRADIHGNPTTVASYLPEGQPVDGAHRFFGRRRDLIHPLLECAEPFVEALNADSSIHREDRSPLVPALRELQRLSQLESPGAMEVTDTLYRFRSAIARCCHIGDHLRRLNVSLIQMMKDPRIHGIVPMTQPEGGRMVIASSHNDILEGLVSMQPLPQDHRSIEGSSYTFAL